MLLLLSQPSEQTRDRACVIEQTINGGHARKTRVQAARKFTPLNTDWYRVVELK
jgi:hypothetical protein